MECYIMHAIKLCTVIKNPREENRPIIAFLPEMQTPLQILSSKKYLKPYLIRHNFQIF